MRKNLRMVNECVCVCVCVKGGGGVVYIWYNFFMSGDFFVINGIVNEKPVQKEKRC